MSGCGKTWLFYMHSRLHNGLQAAELSTSDYLDRLLLRYSGTFDIHKPYTINEQEYDAYGYFHSHVEKYVLVREANMWSSNSYEHILFLNVKNVH